MILVILILSPRCRMALSDQHAWDSVNGLWVLDNEGLNVTEKSSPGENLLLHTVQIQLTKAKHVHNRSSLPEEERKLSGQHTSQTQ